MSRNFAHILALAALFSAITCLGQQPKNKVDDLHRTVIKSSFGDSSLVFLDEALILIKKKRYNKRLALNSNLRGEYYMKLREDIVAFQHFQAAINTFDKLESSDYYNNYIAYWNTATILYRNRHFSQAINYYDSAYVILDSYKFIQPEKAKRDNVLAEMCAVNYYHALSLKRLGNINAASDKLFETRELAKQSNLKGYPQRIFNQIGLIKKDYQDFSGAREYYDKVLDISREDKYATQALHNKGLSYMSENDFNLSEKYFAESIALSKRLIDQKETKSIRRQLFISHLDLGEVYFKQALYKEAIEQWEMALETYDDLKGRPDFYIVHNWLLQAYLELDTERNKVKEHNQLFLAYSKAFSETRKELADVLSQSLFSSQLARYEEAQAQEAVQAKTRKTYSVYLIIVVLLAIVAMGFLVWYLVYKRSATFYRQMLKAARKE